MAWDGIFKEAAKIGKREITVKKDTLSPSDVEAIQSWSDVTLFKVRGLNRLLLSGFSEMREMNSQLFSTQQPPAAYPDLQRSGIAPRGVERTDETQDARCVSQSTLSSP